MLKFSPLTITPEGDYIYTTDLKLLKVTTEELEFHEKQFATRSPLPEIAEKMATSEWSWYMRCNTTTYVQRCIAAWDNLTNAGAPLMAKPGMDKSADLCTRFTDYLHSDLCFYCQNVCTYFDKVLPHLRFLLPPYGHQWHGALMQTLNELTESCTQMKEAIAADAGILKVETEKASA